MLSILSTLMFINVFIYGHSKEIPIINPNFVANTIEVDETNTTIVEQRLVFDIDLRRSMMYAEGSLVHGAMQQIRRCDIHPQGWMSSSGGPNIDDPSTWTCTNTTISRKAELPNSCQYSTFWSFPTDMKYAGRDLINNTSCDQWIYFNNGDEYSLWVEEGVINGEMTTIPIANGKIKTSSSTGSLWTIYYHDFIPGTPEESEYAPVDGSNCPDSTPP